MYLSDLYVKNFRRLKDAELKFQPGLNVIVGENNSGKTAIVDAILTVLNSRTSELDDVCFDGEKRCEGFSIVAVFDGLNVPDEAAFLEALIPAAETGKYLARFAVSATVKGQDLERTTEVGLGGKSGTYYEVLKRHRLDYLQALRDPRGIAGLRAGRQSKQAGLLKRTATEEEQEALCEIAAGANKDMKLNAAVDRANTIVNENLKDISGLAFLLGTDLNFVVPDFERLAGQLEGYADGLPVVLTGLGYGNLIYIATVLGDLKSDKEADKRYRALVIEEPEAHLHPQQQILLLRFLEAQMKSDSGIQVFVTTHSPILASQAAMSNLLPLLDVVEYDQDGELTTKTSTKPVTVNTTTENAVRISQYLDATRSELFFAKKLLMVEGDSERLLLPAIFQRWKGETLEKSGVMVVSAAGLNFHWFLPFIGADALNAPVAIITDADPPKATVEGEEIGESAYVTKLKSLVEKEPRIEIFSGSNTFEYDLALADINQSAILDAIEKVRVRKGREFREASRGKRDKIFADDFYATFFADGSTSKPVFAMELALQLEAGAEFEVPDHLVKAFEYVLKEKRPRSEPTS